MRDSKRFNINRLLIHSGTGFDSNGGTSMRNRTPLAKARMIFADGVFSPENGEDAAVTGMQCEKGIFACLHGCGDPVWEDL